MKILALNCGSSSLKYQLFDWTNKEVIATGVVERIGIGDSFIEHKVPTKDYKKKIKYAIDNHETAIQWIINALTTGEGTVIESMEEISAVGHRVVHGGEQFNQSVLITDDVINHIGAVSHLAPLHNPANLVGIRAARTAMPKIPHVAIFDTAFHQSMPEHAYLYALPYEWYKDFSVRRYGFHGTSHLYVSKRAAALMGKNANECNIITLHIGNGVSCAAIKKGLSIDTTMGFTPLAGAIMGTRCGDIDPAIPMFMMQRLDVGPRYMDNLLNKKSGVLGITGKYTDRRDIEVAAEAGDSRCKLAIEMEAYKLRKSAGEYAFALGSVDAIVFTAGVGENSGLIRQKTLEGLEFFGIKIDKEKNMSTFSKHGETEISTPDSKVKVFMIPTNEELVFVEDVVAIIQDQYEDHTKYPYTFLK
ncbi:acetate kinase [Desulfobotulus alkaliphilus]|uniref:Acetate kinase n=1 Tax=Desulfobotulus alkaliphilus TaxID=622671 RepID=A0A562RW84_9BACT|nr:acetate kinase [Desulfobotulus alkaliphilus]TWI73268.1 acetate kinase [Desulfobotulus alkaliphilus]